MFKKGTKAYSVFNNKCPKCQEGDFFKNKISYTPSKVTKIHDNCPKCDLKYMLEPSFFYGAMYVGYGITVATCVITFLISKLIFNATLLESFAVILIASLLLMPLNLRVSRILWINMFIAFDKNTPKETP
jgi:uncharacterized protein (DUF983 family)